MDSAGRITFTTDVMVGFPGETSEDFNLTCKALETVGFLRAHVFRYSKREGTAAYRMEGQVPENVKKERERELQSVVKKMCYNVKKSFEGMSLDVLVERNAENGWEGYSSEYVPVAFAGGSGLLNEIVTVTGKTVKGGFLIGEK